MPPARLDDFKPVVLSVAIIAIGGLAQAFDGIVEHVHVLEVRGEAGF